MEKRYFGTDGIRGRVGESPITAEFMLKLGWAAGKALASESGAGGKVLIGKDTRISGYMFESALEAGLSAAGVDIALLGVMPTPGVAYLTRTLRASAGIVISASHNPYDDNGVKFFSPQGAKLPDSTEFAIESLIDAPLETVEGGQLGKAERIVDARGRYIEFCKSTIPASIALNDLKVVVDCGNGATYHIAPEVLGELGADVSTIGTLPDGININRDCGATSAEALRQSVLDSAADVGVAFDGDGDRLIMVDATGAIVDGDELLYVIARDRLSNGQHPGGVVGTLMSNLGLEVALRELDLALHRAKVGDRYVLEKLVAEGLTLGGESSGHIICLDRTTTGDGIISALQVLTAMAQTDKPLAELRSGMSKFPQTMINVPVKGTFDLADELIVQAVSEAENQLGDYGRVLLRPSGTEPVVRVMVEGANESQVASLAQDLAGTVSAAAEP